MRPRHARRSAVIPQRNRTCVMVLAAIFALAAGVAIGAQEPAVVSAPPPTANPIAIVPVDSGATVTGALQVSAGKTLIAGNGSVTSADKTTEVVLPRRGMLRVCASTTVKLATDTSVPAGETPGLMMALDHGAVEADFATVRNSDILLTPDFRILISGPGAAEVKVRLGQRGDTCVDNPGLNAPYVLVTSVFDGGMYRVQPGQRVMFQHGSLQEVVDQEKEPCGCPPAATPNSNEFPAAQSAGLAPLQPPAPAPPPAAPVQPSAAQTPATTQPSAPSEPAVQTPTEPLVYPRPASPPPAAEVARPPASEPAAEPDSALSSTPIAQPSPVPAPAAQKPDQPGFFKKIGRFFRRLFGAE